MADKYIRASFEVEAVKYEQGKGLEDGFKFWKDVVTNGWVTTDGLVRITRDDGAVVCPFVHNRRGIVFIREGDYIIIEEGNQKHCCGEDKFDARFRRKAESI